MQLRRYTSNFTRDRWQAMVPNTAVELDDNGRVLLPIWQISAINS